jgi:hypothetical protein
MKRADGKPLVESWNEVASSLLRWGDMLIRFGVFLALVYGTYYAISAGVQVINGEAVSIGSKPLSYLINAVITFICITILSRIVERKIANKSFRVGGLAALIVGAILLVVATVSGFIIIFGGFFVILAVEIRRPSASFEVAL